MQKTISQCSECGNTTVIVNKKHKLCNVCNRKRLGTETKQWKPKKTYQLKRTPIKKSSKRIKVSGDSSAIKQAYSVMADTRERVCTGCGTTKQLTHSHIIPRSRRKDLEASLDNLTYHCMSCHIKWESGTPKLMKELNDFDSMMDYISRIDEKYHLLLKSKF